MLAGARAPRNGTILRMRYIGIDYGSKKIGVALSDEAGTMGFPHAIVPRAGAEAAFIKLFADNLVDAAVIGESKNFAGEDNPIAREARAFGAWVGRHFSVPVYWEPEVFTSAEARRAPAKEGKSRAALPRAQVDASAAALILTSFLTRRKGARR